MIVKLNAVQYGDPSMRIMKTPRSLDLFVTGRCNLRCTYCSHFTSPGDVDQDLSTEEWLRFFEELKRCAVMKVCFQGGEPFLRDDLAELILGVARNRMRFSILTNGTLITDETAALVASTGRCDLVQVSIDGSISTTHDAARGKGSFRKALDGLLLLMKHRVPATARITIHRGNVLELEQIASFLLEEIRLPGFSTNSATPFGLCRRNAEQVQLTVAERTLAMEALVRLNSKYDGRISAQAGPLAEALNWSAMEEARRSGEGSFSGGGRLTGCGGPMSELAVRCDGVMIPCGHLSHMELGVINRDGLAEVWQGHPDLKRLRNRSSIALTGFESCRGCDYLPYCTGNCPAVAYAMTGDAWRPSPDACYRRFKEAGGRLPSSSSLE